MRATAMLERMWPWHYYFFAANLSVPHSYSLEYKRDTLFYKGFLGVVAINSFR